MERAFSPLDFVGSGDLGLRPRLVWFRALDPRNGFRQALFGWFREVKMERAFSPLDFVGPDNLGRWPRLVWFRAFGPLG
jgi:hypothetical protein